MNLNKRIGFTATAIFMAFVVLISGCQATAAPSGMKTITETAATGPTASTLPAAPQAAIATSTPASTPVETQSPTAIRPTLTTAPSATRAAPAATATVKTNPPAGGAKAIIADHTSANSFASIPAASLQTAAGIKTLFMHQSTGDNIRFMGLQCLAGLQGGADYPQECRTLALNPYHPYDNRLWKWKLWAEPMADAIAKTDQWVSVVKAEQGNYQVLGMKLCYVDGWNLDFEVYRTKMEQLERAYPQKIFIWSTAAMWAQSEVAGNQASAENIQAFNQHLRAYARANSKILYDIADIESHDPAGNACQANKIEALCDAYFKGMGGGGGGHPDMNASIRLAKGFWWLMAAIGDLKK